LRSIQRQRLALARMSPDVDRCLPELEIPIAAAALAGRDALGLGL
jgi:hypothetical protein